jgi:hypothetical protein
MPKKKAEETKAQRFHRLAERRVNTLIKVLRLVGNLSSRKNYVYSEEQVQQMFGAIDQEVRLLKSRFRTDSGSFQKNFKFNTGEKK